MVLLKGKVFKVGGSYAVRVPKAYVDGEIVKEGQETVWELVEQEENKELYSQKKSIEVESAVEGTLTRETWPFSNYVNIQG